MYRNKSELFGDIMLGEAVLQLIQDGDAVNSETLLKALTRTLACEKDLERHQACLVAISKVCSGKEDTANRVGCRNRRKA